MAFSPGFAWRRGMMGLGAMGRTSKGRMISAGRNSGIPIVSDYNNMLAYRRGKRRMLGIASGAAVLEAGRHMPAGEPWAGYRQTSTGAYNSYY